MTSSRKTIKIFIASSIDEFEIERLKLKNFINDLSRKLQKQGMDVDLEPIACEEMSQITSLEAEQDRINELIKGSDFCFVLIGNEVGKFTLLEYDVAVKHFVETGLPRVVVTIRKQPDGCGQSQSVKDFIDYRYQKQKHYTNTFESVDSIKVMIILELLNSNLLSNAQFRVQDGTVNVGGASLNDIIDINSLPIYNKNDVLNYKKEELVQLRSRRADVASKLSKQPGNRSIEKMLSNLDVSINELSDDIHQIENDILELLRRVLIIDRSENVTNRQVMAVEALEIGDYETAKAILSGDQWIATLTEADHAIDYSKRLKDEAEKSISVNTSNIEQEISTQRLRISVLKTTGVNDVVAQEIKGIYEVIIEYSIKYNLETDVIIEYARFLADQEDYKNAIRIGKMLEGSQPQDYYVICQCYYLLGNMLRQRNDMSGTQHYGDLLHSLAEENVSPNIKLLAEIESLVLKEKCQSMGSEDLEKFASKALKLIPDLRTTFPVEAFSIEFEARYWLALHKRELIMLPDSHQMKRYKAAIAEFSDFLPQLREKAEINPDENTKSLSMWLNSFANLYKKAQDLEIDENGFLLAEPLRIEAYQLLHDAYQINHAKYAHDYALACQTLGNLYRSLYRFNASKEYHSESLPIFRMLYEQDADAHINDYANECNNYVNLLKSIGEIDDAEIIASEGIQAYEQYGIETDEFELSRLECMVKLHDNLALFLIQKGSRQEAIKHKRKADEYQRRYTEIVKKEKKKETVIESVSFLKKYPNKISFDIDTATEEHLRSFLDDLTNQENGNRIERVALMNRRSLCLVSEKLFYIDKKKYRSQFAYWCCLLGLLNSSGSFEERKILYRNACIICDEIGLDDPDLYVNELFDIYKYLTEFDENLYNDQHILLDTYIWNRYLLIDIYKRQIKQLEKTAHNVNTTEWNIGTEYSFIADKYYVRKAFDLAIIAAKHYREHMLVGKDAQAKGDIWLADACVTIAKSINSSPMHDESVIKYLKEAEAIVSKYANSDFNAYNIMIKCLINYAEAYAKDHDRNSFNYYSNKLCRFIEDSRIPDINRHETLNLNKNILNMMRKKHLDAPVLKLTEAINSNTTEKGEESIPIASGKSIHYRKIQKLKKQGLSKDEVVRKLKLSYATVNANWDD